jgi:hypothetical protein
MIDPRKNAVAPLQLLIHYLIRNLTSGKGFLASIGNAGDNGDNVYYCQF